MHRPRVPRLAALLTSWTVVPATAWGLATERLHGGMPAEWLAAGASAAACAVAAWAVKQSRDIRWRVPAAMTGWAMLLVAPLIALSLATGGLRSTAVPALALTSLCALWSRPRRVSIAFLVLASVVLALAPGAPSLPHQLAGAALLGTLLVLPRYLVAAAEGRVARERQRASRLGGLLGERMVTPVRLRAFGASGRQEEGGAAGMRGPARAADATTQRDLLSHYLRDVRDWADADEAIFWCWDDAQAALVALAWSTPGADGPQYIDESWRPLVAWSTSERLAQLHPSEAPRVAICPVEWGRGALGALTLSRDGAAIARDSDELRLWLPRFAAHVAALSDVVAERDAVARRGRQAVALLAATRDFPTVGTVEKLAHALFASALTLTSGRRAALIQWSPEEGRGTVDHVSAGHPLHVKVGVTEKSYVGAACAAGRPFVWEDAALLDPECRVYGEGEPTRILGALGIVPVVSEGEVRGALVIEGDEPREVRADDRRALRHLADLASASLVRLQRTEDEMRKATTDPLTGLRNRRYFDEQLAQELAKVDRFGGSVSLLVGDVDHFKRVNDTHGHEVGDAVLRSLASTFRKSVRDVDVPARFGGEELVVLLPQTDLPGALLTAERLRQAVESQPVRIAGRDVRVTMSFGVATFPRNASTREAIFAVADRALYRAKADGRNCVRSAPPRDSQTKA